MSIHTSTSSKNSDSEILDDGGGVDGVGNNGNGNGRKDRVKVMGENDSNQSVTGLRACFIIGSLGVLIFLQGM